MLNGDASGFSWIFDSSRCWDDHQANLNGARISLERPIFRFDVPSVLTEGEGSLKSVMVDIPWVGRGFHFVSPNEPFLVRSGVLITDVYLANMDVADVRTTTPTSTSLSLQGSSNPFASDSQRVTPSRFCLSRRQISNSTIKLTLQQDMAGSNYAYPRASTTNPGFDSLTRP
ncbi:hypothetical protein C8F04DRAFT_1179431 [Mycena alexandri]|uniref:Uncharacterized protein n=1 Tax=Mycena alexandri TaxID=1745969 RepID=A0AAD6T3R4_9AGAR|nr:hypothetical protein C8F04DRAFT_1179431 [Mycena alexandri]